MSRLSKLVPPKLRAITHAAEPAPGSAVVDAVGRILPAMAAHTADYAEALGAHDLTRYEQRVFSQNGEDGVIAEILSRVGVGPRWFVEFGIGTGHQGNCVLLADVYGWNGLFCEPDPEGYAGLQAKYRANPRVRTDPQAITPGNIEAVFERHGVPEDLDVLSIDVDTIDYWIWKAVARYRPRLVVIEYNGSLSVDEALVYPYDDNARWDETAYYGSSLGAFRQLGAEKGYRLAHTELNGVNAFFVRDDLAATVGVDEPPLRTTNFGLTGAAMPPDPHQRAWQRLG
jgi:hypothetical protein